MDKRRERRFQMRARGGDIAPRKCVPEQTLAVRDDEVTIADGAECDERTPPLDGRIAVVQRDLW